MDAFVSVFGYEFRTWHLDAKRDAVLDYLRNLQTPSLIVLDNAENMADPALWKFLEGMPQGSSALVATRDALTREGLHIDVPKMEYEEAIGLFKEKDGHFENKKPGLFISAARRATNNYLWGKRLSNADMDVLKEIDQILDGHPLGIKLAAALVASDSLESIREKLRAAPPREVSDRFDFSYSILTGSQKELLNRLAAFSGLINEWAIESISSRHFFEEDKVEPLQYWRYDLSELVRKSFVDVFELHNFSESVQDVAKPRYRLHPLMRQYVGIKTGDEAMLSNYGRLANLFLEYAEKYSKDYDSLESEHINLLSGADWAYAAKKWALIKRFVNAIEAYLDQRGYWKEERLLLERAVEAAEKLGDKIFMASLLHKLGILVQNTGDLLAARRFYLDCLKMEREIGNSKDISHTLWHLATLMEESGDEGDARELYEEILELARESKDNTTIAFSLIDLGFVASASGDIMEARRLFGDSLRISQEIEQEIEDKVVLARLYFNLAELAKTNGDLAESKTLHQKSLKISEEQGDKGSIADSLNSLGELAEENGNLEEARKLYQESFKIYQELGDKGSIADSLNSLGELAEENGNLEEARKLYQESFKIYQELGDKGSSADSLNSLGKLAQKNDDFIGAKKFYNGSLKIARELGHKKRMACPLHCLGKIAQKNGDINESLSLYQECLKLKHELGNKGCIAKLHHDLGTLAEANGNLDEARKLYQESSTEYQELDDLGCTASILMQFSLMEKKAGEITHAQELIKRAEAILLELDSPMAAHAQKIRESMENT